MQACEKHGKIYEDRKYPVNYRINYSFYCFHFVRMKISDIKTEPFYYKSNNAKKNCCFNSHFKLQDKIFMCLHSDYHVLMLWLYKLI